MEIREVWGCEGGVDGDFVGGFAGVMMGGEWEGLLEARWEGGRVGEVGAMENKSGGTKKDNIERD